MTPFDFDCAHADLLLSARPSVGYCEEHGIDFGASAAHAGGLFMSPVTFISHRTFRPDPLGDLACWIAAYDIDAETAIDVVAWAPTRPHDFYRLSGCAPALGLAAGANPATYALGGALRLHQTPNGWLKSGCVGAVILDRVEGARWLMGLDAPRIAAEDRAHARDLVLSMERLIGRHRFVVPTSVRKAA